MREAEKEQRNSQLRFLTDEKDLSVAFTAQDLQHLFFIAFCVDISF
jgi:hypothetical protein